jgi:hypothetical protein
MAATYALPAHVMLRSVGEELVLLNLETEKYFGLDEVGAAMIKLIQSGASLPDAAAALAEEYDAPAETIAADLDALCAELVDEGLLQAT